MRIAPRIALRILWIGLSLALLSSVAFAEEPEKVEYCQLKRDPAKYNHKLIEVKAFVTHGFEDSNMFNANCASYPAVWVEYGGKTKTGTMYCCGESNSRSRPKPPTVESIPVGLVEDETFQRFDRLLHSGPRSIVYATVVGRFFAGKKTKLGTFEETWEGYGHMGCCSLLVIERVLGVDPHGNPDLDYSNSNVFGPSCDYQILTGTTVSFQLRALQRAESTDSWAFADATRVAQDAVVRIAKDEDREAIKIPPTVMKKSAGLMVYQWHPKKDVFYIFVLSRPYLLSVYAADPKKVPWVVTDAYKSTCAMK